MKGFEYGVYSPGDFALIEGADVWQEIASYDYHEVRFTDGTSAPTEDVISVRMKPPPITTNH